MSMDHIVLEQSLLKVNEVFIYQIPPLSSSSGFRAEDWNLASPLATCSLSVLQIDDVGILRLFQNVPKENAPEGATEERLFAESKIKLAENKLEHWVQAVTDSSRYFVIRILDEAKNREAHIGLGFRERNDSLNFKMALQDYESSMRKEALLKKSGEELELNDGENVSESTRKLSLGEGEKIHINIKGIANKEKENKKKHNVTGGFVLRKPPPPAGSEGADNMVTNQDEISQDMDDDEWGDFK